MDVMLGEREFALADVRKTHIGKADTEIDVDLTEMPQTAIEYFLDYGIRQSLNDAAAGENLEKGATAETVLAKVNKRLDALRRGELSGTRIRTGDSVKARAIMIAMKHAPADVKAKKDAKVARAWAITAVGRNPAYMSLAQRQLDEEAALSVEFEPAEA